MQIEYASEALGGIDVRLIKGDLPRSFVSGLVNEGSSNVSIDIETSGLDFKSDRIGSIQVYDGRDTIFVVRPPFKLDTPNLKKLISSEEVIKIFHHAMFDLRFLQNHLGISAKNVQCTKIAAKIVLPELGRHSLVELLNYYFAFQLNKGQQQSNWLRSTLTSDQVLYAARDVVYLPRLRNLLMRDSLKVRRKGLVVRSFLYIPTRVELDLIDVSDVFVY